MRATQILQSLGFAACCLWLAAPPSAAQEETLERRLLAEESAALAQAARELGDASRGAVTFHQAYTTCAKCHAMDGSQNGLGPDLTSLSPPPDDAHLVESILAPSKTIRDGFAAVTAITVEGQAITGLVAEDTPERLVLLDLTQNGKRLVLRRSDIESQSVSPQSLMPAGLANQLASRQQFLDLVRYLIEVRDGGLPRARQLQPPPALVALRLPEYENRIDHAGMIRDLNRQAFARGRAIYERLCVNCHGTAEQPGSLPTSLRFASGQFKNGADPYAMYQTLTRGFGLMAPQTWMVPQQKYDVIHYLREAYLKPYNPTQYVPIAPRYLASLPAGDTRGPAPRVIEPWVTMDYGPSLVNTYEIGDDGKNFAYKGIAVRLDPGPGGVSRGHAWIVFDHDTLRLAGAWAGSGFIDWNGIHFNGRHQVHPRVVGDVHLANPTGPGWANPQPSASGSGAFDDDQRVLGRDGRRYGPLPRAWAKYRGLYHHGDRTIVSYSVGDADVLEEFGAVFPEAKPGKASEGEQASPAIFTRTLNVGPRTHELRLLVATQPSAPPLTAHEDGVAFGSLAAGVLPAGGECAFVAEGARLCLRIPPGEAPLRFVVWMARQSALPAADELAAALAPAQPPPDLGQLLHGGPARWPQRLTTQAVLGEEGGPFAVDVLTHPENNPWLAQMRFTGLDILPGGNEMAVCAWDGDVWLVSGLAQLDASSSPPASSPQLTWQRIASGLFQPLGIKYVAGKLYVTCRDQLVVLHDRNGDGETDFYECFNNDHQVTEHFHEFAMGLQTDEAGNFYYAKSARHALPAVVPHHGTLLRVSADGARTDILATGFRAANGVCLNPDGSFVVTDQEGHWNPKNRINWVTEGGFYGNMFGYHDVTDSSDEAMQQPLCWITNAFDRSPGELVWVPQDAAWGPLGGSLLNLSYGYGKLFVVPFEEVAGHKQGGLCALPVGPLPTGVMRGRFHPADRCLYACGMFAWAGSATQPGGLYRIRYTGKPAYLPVAIHARRGALEVTFTDPLDRAAASDLANYAMKTWSLRRTANYGSNHEDEKPLPIQAVQLSADGRTVTLVVPDLRPTWGMEIVCRLQGEDGERCERVIHNSIFYLRE